MSGADSIATRIDWMVRVGYPIRFRRPSIAKDIAADAGVSESAFSNYRTGKREPEETETVIALARALGCDPGWLFAGAATDRRIWPEGWEPPDATRIDREIAEVAPILERHHREHERKTTKKQRRRRG